MSRSTKDTPDLCFDRRKEREKAAMMKGASFNSTSKIDSFAR